MVHAMQQEAAWEAQVMNAKLQENASRLRENARLDMERYEAKKAYDRQCDLAVDGSKTSLISGLNDPVTTMDMKKTYHRQLEQQEEEQRARKARETQELREVGWTSLPMQPAWHEEDDKKQYQKDLLAQMALQKKQAEYHRLKEQTDVAAERQRGEVRSKQVEHEEALAEWMSKQVFFENLPERAT